MDFIDVEDPVLSCVCVYWSFVFLDNCIRVVALSEWKEFGNKNLRLVLIPVNSPFRVPFEFAVFFIPAPFWFSAPFR